MNDSMRRPRRKAKRRTGAAFAATARSCRLDAVISRRRGDGDHDRQLRQLPQGTVACRQRLAAF
jgi:hypothetical protein